MTNILIIFLTAFFLLFFMEDVHILKIDCLSCVNYNKGLRSPFNV